MTTEQKLERIFNEKVERTPDGCILFQGACINGYPLFYDGGYMKPIYKVLWERQYGPVPDRRNLKNRCNHRNCINVQHWTLPEKKAKRIIEPELIRVYADTAVRAERWDLLPRIRASEAKYIEITLNELKMKPVTQTQFYEEEVQASEF